MTRRVGWPLNESPNWTVTISRPLRSVTANGGEEEVFLDGIVTSDLPVDEPVMMRVPGAVGLMTFLTTMGMSR